MRKIKEEKPEEMTFEGIIKKLIRWKKPNGKSMSEMIKEKPIVKNKK